MKLGVGLGVGLGTSLTLTPQLQQAIRLLQLSALELQQEIQNQLDSNPLLEQEENTGLGQEAADTADGFGEEAAGPDLADQLRSDHIQAELPVDVNWDDVYIHQPTGAGSGMEDDEREDIRVYQQSLQDHLTDQVRLLRLNPLETLMMHCLIDSIDERGYLCDSDEVLLQTVQQQLPPVYAERLELADLRVVIHHLQQCEPAGVGARDLPECLQLQLRALPADTPFLEQARRLLLEPQLLASHDMSRLMRQTGLNVPELQQAISLIRTLKPYPGSDFGPADDVQQVPDVIVQRRWQQGQARWEVALNPDTLPRLRVNRYYAGMIRRADSSADNQYLRQHMQEARNFIKGVEERHKTLLKVASCIVQHQQAFLEHGAEAMNPLILRDVADETGLHESTVSRVTMKKYLLTPRGLFELKYFFSSHVGTSVGGECSSTAIRAMIRKMVQEEDTRKPLSDSTIAERLQRDGIDIARRTVAKYRESLNIGSSSERRRMF